MRYIALIILIFTSFTYSAAQTEASKDMEWQSIEVTVPDTSVADTLAVVRYDSSNISARSIDAKKLEKFRADKDFIYQEAEEPEGFWQKVQRWFWETVYKMFSNEGAAPYVRYIVIFVIIVVVWLLLRNTKMFQLFFRNNAQSPGFEEITENIHEIDFETVISEAIANGNYRRASRYLYLLLLKQLSDASLIDWKPYKTNYDYNNELQKTQYYNDFRSLTRHYEYIWYGNFEPDSSTFEGIHANFRSMYKQIPQTTKVSQ